MDCYRSFVLGISQTKTFNTITNVKSWGAVGNYHWVVDEGGSSIFLIQGFKKIDLYGMKMIGSIQAPISVGNGAIVEDYQFEIVVDAITPLISGVVQTSPNVWGINPNQNIFQLGKYSNDIMFASPYSGCESIDFNGIKIQGNNGETLNSVELEINLQFIFYYKFEGE